MSFEIILVLGIVAAALLLFVTEWLPMDLVALLVLATLAVTRLVSPSEALAGFSNPAVVTVWAMFILSAALARTGVAGAIGSAVLRWSGRGEARIVTVIMMTGAVLSAFMNNIGVAALMLPVVLDVARRTGRPPSRLLMPLAFGTLLGGLTTLIGTPPNLLVADALTERGLESFGMFDYSPVGVLAMLAGVAFVALVGRRMLPQRDPAREASAGPMDLGREYGFEERTAVMRIPKGSLLTGRSLEQSRIGQATGLNVYAVLRNGRTILAPGPQTALEEDDRLLVKGALDRFNEMREWRQLEVVSTREGLPGVVSDVVGLAELTVASGGALDGRTLRQVDFRNRFSGIVLAHRREGQVRLANLARVVLRAGDRLLVQGERTELGALGETRNFDAATAIDTDEVETRYNLRESVFAVQIPADSTVGGRSLAEGRIGDALGLGVIGFQRGGTTHLLPRADERIDAGDRLLVRGRKEDIDAFRGLLSLMLEAESAPHLGSLDSDQGMFEVMLSPRTSLAGRTIAELRFRERYGLQAVALLRGGQVLQDDLRNEPLRFGDALLLLGSLENQAVLQRDPDFLTLSGGDAAPVVDRARAPLAASIMAAVLVPVLAGWIPIATAAVTGVALVVLTRCISMDEAYRAIEWRAIFLIAGMLPLGTALQSTGAAELVAEGIIGAAGGWGPWGILISLYLITAAATSIIPTAALVVLMAPIAFRASASVGLSEHAVMMAIAMAASASFTSPVSHPANLLVMGPGGYRFVDFIKVGLPLTLLVLVVVLLALPWFWPLTG